MDAKRPTDRLQLIVRVVLFAASALFHVFVIVPFCIARLVPLGSFSAPKEELFDCEEGDGDDSSKEDGLCKSALAVRIDEDPLPSQKKPPDLPQPKKLLNPTSPKKAPTPQPLVRSLPAKKKSVDQDQFPDEDDNPDARFLAQKNHRTVKEQVAKRRTLEDGPQGRGSSGVPPQASVPKSGGSPQEGGSSPIPGFTPDVFSLHPLPRSSAGQGTGPGTAPGKGKGPGSLMPKSLAELGLEPTPQQARAAAKALLTDPVTPRQNQWAQQKETGAALNRAYRENFVPGIAVGEDSNLGTRKNLFAEYLSTIHRRIHAQWGYKMLPLWDRTPGGGPPEDAKVRVLIVINPDGQLCAVGLNNSSSGHAGFDRAALYAVVRAAPFPAPPPAMKSKNGQVYVSWGFFRNSYDQCATDYAETHILKRTAVQACEHAFDANSSSQQKSDSVAKPK